MAKHHGMSGHMGEKHTGRHHQLHHDMTRKDGGGIGDDDKMVKEESYAGTGSNVEKEAEERRAKRGGRMKRAHGGAVHKRHPMMVEGHKGGHRLDRPGRKRGGAVGADSKPFTSAHNLEPPEGMAGGAYGTHLGKESYSAPMSAKTDKEDD